MARRSSLLVSLALASLFLGLAAALSTTSIASEVEPLTGSAAAVTAGSSSAVVASVTSSADVAQAEPATAVVRNLEEQPSRASEANIEPADTEEYPGGDDVTEETSNNKGEGLAVETAPQLQGPGQAEAQALPDSSSTEAFEPVPVIRVGCGGIITVRMLEPNVLGGLMLRGRGNIVFVRALPRMTLSRSEMQPGFDPASAEPGTPQVASPSESSSSSASGNAMRPRPLPFSEGVDPEGVARSMESLFAIAHPLTLFRENMEELDQWHAARMRALAALHGAMIHRMMESSLEEPTAVSAAGAAGAGTAAEGATVEQSQPAQELVAGPELDASTLGDMGPIEWNSTAVGGLVLLGLSLSLLLSMLLMGLSSLIYDAPEDEEVDEKAAARREASVQTPLLKFLEVEEEPDEKATVNPVCKYEPPAQK